MVPIVPSVRTLTVSNVAPNPYLFTDNFNRTEIGPNWTIIQQGGTGWQIQNGQLCHPDAGGILPRIRVTYLNLSESLIETDLQPAYVRQFDELGLAFRIRDTGNMYMGIIYAANSNTTFDSVFFQKMINGTKHWSPLHRIAPIAIGLVRFGVEVTNVGSDMNINFQVNRQSVWNYSYYQTWGNPPEFALGYVGIYMGGWMPACYGNFDVAMPQSRSITPPSADFHSAPLSPIINSSLNLTATISGGTPPYSCTWDLGDGSTRVGCLATYAYTRAGSFNVTLTVQDYSSPRLTTSKSHSIIVQPTPLQGTLSFSPMSPNVSSQVSFVATLSGGTSPYDCAWNFGDGRVGNGCTVTHAFTVAGSFAVTVIVTDHSQPPLSKEVGQVIAVGQSSPLPPPKNKPTQPELVPQPITLLILAASFALGTFAVGSYYTSRTRNRLKSVESGR